MLKRDKGRRRDEDEEDDDRPRKSKRDRDDDDGGGKKKFKFKKRSKEQVSRRESGGMFDAPFKPKFKTFQPKQGDFRVRLMPATFKGAEHYGLDTYVHYGIGVDNNRYLCRRKMEKYTPDEDPTCAVCDEFEVAKRDGDDDYAKELRSNRGILVWVIDRDHEKDGPKLWMMPGTVDQEIAKRSVDKRSGDTINPEDPEEGRDIDFSRSGEGIKTKYTGVNLASKATPLSDDEEQQDEWLDYIVENPLDEVLNFFPAEYVTKVFGGGAAKGKGKDDEDEYAGYAGRRGKKRSRDEDEDDEDKPRKKSKRDADEDDEDEEDEEDEDDRPRKKRKVIEDEDEELDEDEDDEDKPRKRKSRDEDEDDEDDRPRKKKRVQAEDDEDDEDDCPRKSKKRVEEDDDDEEDDEEDEEPRKKSKLKDKLREGLRKRRD